MRISVVTALEAGVEKAYAINSINMAQGFAKLGHDVTLITFQHRDGRRSDQVLHDQYDIRQPLRWIQLPRKFRGKFINPDEHFSYMAFTQLWRVKPDFVFARNYIAPIISARWDIPTVAESHAHVDNRTPPFLKMIAATQQQKQFRYLVTISDVLSEHYQSLGVPSDKMLVLPTGVDMNRFTRPDVLPASPYTHDKPNIAYVGHLYDYKGIPTILETANLCPDYKFHLVGGLQRDIDALRARIDELHLSNVILHGYQHQSNVPPYLWHADVLLLPPSLNHPSARWTSPVKLGEYLASGTPIVVSQIPAMIDWLTNNEVMFFQPDSAHHMATAIRDTLSNGQVSQARVQAGLQLAQSFSYQRRAQIILEKCGV